MLEAVASIYAIGSSCACRYRRRGYGARWTRWSGWLLPPSVLCPAAARPGPPVEVVDVQAAKACHMQTVAGRYCIVLCIPMCASADFTRRSFVLAGPGAWAVLLPRHPKAVRNRLPVSDSIVQRQQIVDMPGSAA